MKFWLNILEKFYQKWKSFSWKDHAIRYAFLSGDVLYVLVGQEGESACVHNGVETREGLCSQMVGKHFNLHWFTFQHYKEWNKLNNKLFATLQMTFWYSGPRGAQS